MTVHRNVSQPAWLFCGHDLARSEVVENQSFPKAIQQQLNDAALDRSLLSRLRAQPWPRILAPLTRIRWKIVKDRTREERVIGSAVGSRKKVGVHLHVLTRRVDKHAIRSGSSAEIRCSTRLCTGPLYRCSMLLRSHGSKTYQCMSSASVGRLGNGNVRSAFGWMKQGSRADSDLCFARI